MLPTPEQVKSYIEQGIACQFIAVEGDGQHFLQPSLALNLKG